MGLLCPVAEMIVSEHAYKPITGDLLYVARQTVFLSDTTLDILLRRYGLQNKAEGPVEWDIDTRGRQQRQLITDKYFARALGVDNVRSLDVTAYEGADIIHDLGEPIGPEHHAQFDFIYNGGCFDNMFNPGVALMNLSKMLKPGGRIVCMESATSWNSPYLMFGPAWFYDFFAFNKYADCKLYLGAYGDDSDALKYGPWSLYHVTLEHAPDGPVPLVDPSIHLIWIVIAEKGENSTDTFQPVQAQYRTTPELKNRFAEGHGIIQSSKRPIWSPEGAKPDESSMKYCRELGHISLDLRLA